MENIFVEFLPPWVETGLQPAFYDKESGTVLQQTARMYDRVNMLVRMFNKLSKETAEKFNNLYNYVHDYFDNLDVQEEINNKLDEMVEDGTLEELIADYLGKRVEFISPGFVPNTYSFDANLIRVFKEDSVKNIMVDCGLYSDWYYISEMLVTNGITHLDYFILTHYHSDHDGNIQNLINNHYIDKNTTILVGAEYTGFNADYNSRMVTDLGYFTTAGLTYRTPTEGEVIEIDDLKLTFHNTSEDVLAGYNTTNANNGSLVFLAEFDNTKALYLGDALTPVYNYLYSINFPDTSVDLFKIGHHGIESATNNEYIYHLAPTYAIQTSGILDFAKNNFGLCAEISIMKSINTKIYPAHIQPGYIKFVACQNNISCVQGLAFGYANQEIRQTYYVDANASDNSIQNGSSTYPFRELMQAISAVQKTNAQEITINVADGEYGVSHETQGRNEIYINTGKSSRITINGSGDTWINNFFIENSYVYLKDIKIDVDNDHGIEATHSDITLDGVTISSKTSTQSTHNGVMLSNFSNCDVRGASSIDYVQDAMVVNSGSLMKLTANLTIGANVTGSVVSRTVSSQVITNDYLQFTDSAKEDAFTRYGYNQYAPISIMENHENYATTVTLNKSAANFDWIEIYLHTNDGKYYNTGRIYSPNNKVIGVYVPSTNNANTHMYNKQCQLNIIGTNVTITKSYQIDVTIADGKMSVSSDTGNNYWNILKIVGGFKDYAG